ncbi:MAG: ROK family protein [Bdellovibrionaceae bacterium]|nr:ROK family protein [Pseudobdellovibrionaceae bacterium]MDW8190224.1 ROK family protein [Pseudobdellovibrionaceae bacterium]
MLTKKNKNTDSFVIGIDLGGTKVAAALVKQSGELLYQAKVVLGLQSYSSPRQKKTRLIEAIREVCWSLWERQTTDVRKKIKGIGLASAGPLNVDKKILIHPANFPGFGFFAIVDRLKKELLNWGFPDVPIAFQNDAMAAALGEMWLGGARDLRTFAVVTVGTGIGTGVIINGQPCQSGGMGSEFGHLFVNITSCDHFLSVVPGTVEGIASGTGIIRRAREEMGITCNSVEDLIHRYPQESKILFETSARALGILFYNLSVGLHLQKIFVGGGMSQIHQWFLPQAISWYRRLIRERHHRFECPVELAHLGPDAGVLGAAYCAVSLLSGTTDSNS